MNKLTNPPKGLMKFHIFLINPRSTAFLQSLLVLCGWNAISDLRVKCRPVKAIRSSLYLEIFNKLDLMFNLVKTKQFMSLNVHLDLSRGQFVPQDDLRSLNDNHLLAHEYFGWMPFLNKR